MKEGLVPREVMTRYILGELSEAEQQRIEEAYFTDPAFLQDLLATRNDLIDAFVDGKLNAVERGLFEQRLQASPALVKKVKFAKALFQTFDSEGARPKGTVIPDANQRSLTDRLVGQRSPFWLALWLRPQWGLAAISLLILVGIFWFAVQRNGNRVMPNTANQIAVASPQTSQATDPGSTQERGKMQTPPDPSQAQKQNGVANHSKSAGATTRAGGTVKFSSSIASFLLVAGGSRANDDLRKLEIPAHADRVRLQLEIEEPAAQRYLAVLQTQQGEKIWVKDNLLPLRQRSSRVIVCDLPKTMFENQNYVLHLRPQHKKDAIDLDYSFKISKL